MYNFFFLFSQNQLDFYMQAITNINRNTVFSKWFYQLWQFSQQLHITTFQYLVHVYFLFAEFFIFVSNYVVAFRYWYRSLSWWSVLCDTFSDPSHIYFLFSNNNWKATFVFHGRPNCKFIKDACLVVYNENIWTIQCVVNNRLKL